MNKTTLALSFSGVLMLAASGGGCGGKTHGGTTVVIYLGNSYSCDYTGYCCDDFGTCYTDPTWWPGYGGSSGGGSTGGGSTGGGSTGGGSTGGGSTGGGSTGGGSTGGGAVGGGSTGGGSTGGGSTGGGAVGGGSTGGSTGGGATGGGSTGGSTGGGATGGGSTGGSTGGGSTGASVALAGCADLNGCVANAQNFNVPAALDSSLDQALPGQSKDTGLQSAELQEADQYNRAHGIAQQFSMDYAAALQLTKLADRVQELNAQNGMTTEERETITQAALAVANISTDDVNQAMTKMVQNNDPSAMDNLMEKAASNLGMPSAAGLRDQILPALGIQF